MGVANKLGGLKALLHFDNRIELLINRIFFRKHGLIIYRIKGMDILIDHAAGDECGTREVLTSSMYKQFFPFFTAQNPINVLDLGANGGGFPLLLKIGGQPIKKVVAVECNPNTFLRMFFNLKRNLNCDVIGLNAAVCGKSGPLDLYFGIGGTSDNIYLRTPQTNNERYCIQGLTLDELYEKHFGGELIDVCKMDIEKAEYEVFQAPHHKSIQKCRYLIIEIHKESNDVTSAIRNKIGLIGAITDLGFNELPRRITNEDIFCFKNGKL